MSLDFSVKFAQETKFKVEFGESYSGTLDVPTYTGPYEIEPLARVDKTVYCANKLMTQNLKVLKIPFSSVSNPHGGLTINIGG